MLCCVRSLSAPGLRHARPGRNRSVPAPPLLPAAFAFARGFLCRHAGSWTNAPNNAYVKLSGFSDVATREDVVSFLLRNKEFQKYGLTADVRRASPARAAWREC